MARIPSLRQRPQRGVSLVELMVGLVIGAIAVLVVMQVFRLSEGARRSTVGGDDAQITGALAITTLQREIKQAGYGANAFPTLGCSITLPGGWTIPMMAPFSINPMLAPATPLIPGADPNTDTVLVVRGDKGGSPEGDLVSAQAVQATYSVATPTTFAVGDFVVAAQEWIIANTPRPVATPCALTLERVTAVVAPSPPTVTVGVGVAGMVNGTLYNFGPAPQILAYRVRNGNLTVCDYMVNNCSLAANNDDATIWLPIANGVVSLRAQYGRDTSAPSMDAIVDVFDQAAPATQCDWARVSGLRLAVVARSGELSKVGEEPTTAANAPQWAASDAAPIDLSANPDWQRFRYKTFETTAPLRNMAWQGVQPC